MHPPYTPSPEEFAAAKKKYAAAKKYFAVAYGGVRSDTGVAPLLPPATVRERTGYTPGVRSASKNRKFPVEAGKSPYPGRAWPPSRELSGHQRGAPATQKKRRNMMIKQGLKTFKKPALLLSASLGLWLGVSCQDDITTGQSLPLGDEIQFSIASDSIGENQSVGTVSRSASRVRSFLLVI